MGRITDTVKILLIINVAVYIFFRFVPNLISPDLFIMWFPMHPYFRYWQIITHMFMHASDMHIFFNMFNLYMFGSFIENNLGKQRFIFLYFSAGLGAVGLHFLVDYIHIFPEYQALIEQGLPYDQIILNLLKFDNFKSPVLGASGAIAGVFMAFAVLYPNLELMLMFIPIPIKAKYLIGGYFLIDLYLAITGKGLFGMDNIAHWAHIGGAIIGFIIIWYWKKNSFNDKRWD